MGIHLDTVCGHFNSDIVKVDKYFIDYIIDKYIQTSISEEVNVEKNNMDRILFTNY